MGLVTKDMTARAFESEVARLRAANVPGESGRLRELFEFLAGRGPHGLPASQADIADTVFGQADVAGDDATVRVYVHRLRKRLDEHYAARGDDTSRLTIPAGTYALRFAGEEVALPEAAPAPDARWDRRGLWLVLAAVLLLGGFAVGRWLAPAQPAPNALWAPFLKSNRPLIVVVGDYYMFGELDELRPERGRLIRDFRVNSPTDLARLQESEPDRYGSAEDVGLYYLPLSAADALADLMPALARAHRAVKVIPASQLQPDALRTSDMVYVGLVSGMGMLEDLSFTGSSFEVGQSYDELVDTVAGKDYISQEARNLASPVGYKDYGFVARYHAPGGALVAVVAGERDTALKGIAPHLSGKLNPTIARLAAKGDFEALYQVTGQQGADLSEHLLAARARP